MTELNKDGFAPGQELGFADLMRLRKKASVPTREEIEDMERDDVIALLEANGVEDPKGKISDLRKRLNAIFYPEP